MVGPRTQEHDRLAYSELRLLGPPPSAGEGLAVPQGEGGVLPNEWLLCVPDMEPVGFMDVMWHIHFSQD